MTKDSWGESLSYAIVDRSGRVVESRGPAYPIYGLTKTFIADLVVGLGLDVEARLGEWASESDYSRAGEIRLRHLLNHSSGLRDYGALPEYVGAVERRETPWSEERFMDLTSRRELLFAPGAAFAYSNPGYRFLKLVVERASGLSFAELVERRFRDALGLASVGVIEGEVHSSISGYEAGWVWHGLLEATALDVARFFAGGNVEALRANAIEVPYRDAFWTRPSYAMGLMTEGTRYGHMGAGPGFTAACFRDEATGRTCCAVVPGSQADELLALVLGSLA